VNTGDRLGDEVRRQLLLNPSRYPKLEELCARLRLSAAELKRRLREQGETYQGILDAARRDLAIQYLQETRLPPKEISYRLGFSNVHNFRRAFKTWTGLNPSSFRPAGS
jgi:AraC-like DNA-binding protein